MDKAYVLMSQYTNFDERFTTVHRTLQGAIAAINEDYQENNCTTDVLEENATALELHEEEAMNYFDPYKRINYYITCCRLCD